MHLKRVDMMTLNEEGMAINGQYDAAILCVLSRRTMIVLYFIPVRYLSPSKSKPTRALFCMVEVRRKKQIDF